MHGLLSQHIFQTASGYVDGNSLRHAALSEESGLASGPIFSRLKDIYRLAKGFVDAFITSHASAPSLILLDRDHSENATHGQQELAFYNHRYGIYCYLPLFIFGRWPFLQSGTDGVARYRQSGFPLRSER